MNALIEPTSSLTDDERKTLSQLKRLNERIQSKDTNGLKGIVLEFKELTSSLDEQKNLLPGNDLKIAVLLEKIKLYDSSETHYALLKTIPETHQPLGLKLLSEWCSEFGCESSSEVALVEVMVSCYVRYLNVSEKYTGFLKLTEITSMHLQFYASIGKDLDRAYRHYISSLSTLKQLKAPSLELTVRAKNAYIAQNQQVSSLVVESVDVKGGA